MIHYLTATALSLSYFMTENNFPHAYELDGKKILVYINTMFDY